MTAEIVRDAASLADLLLRTRGEKRIAIGGADRRAVAALALFQQEGGIERRDVDMLVVAADQMHHLATLSDGGTKEAAGARYAYEQYELHLRRIHAKLAALFPPDD